MIRSSTVLLTMAAVATADASWQRLAPYSADFGVATAEIFGDQATAINSGCQSDNDSNNDPIHTFTASCYCGRVSYEARGQPISAKLCHCRGCQQLHGAPFEWVTIFDKSCVRFSTRSSLDFLYFYNSELDQGWDSANGQDRVLPVKVSCSHCRTPIADEGRNMWLAFATLFGFTQEQGIPKAFQHTDHLFYSQRCINVHQQDPENAMCNERFWQGHRGKSPLWRPPNKDDKSTE